MENKIDVKNLLRVVRYYITANKRIRGWDVRAVEVIDNEGKERDGGCRRRCDTKKEAKRVCADFNSELDGN